MPLGKDVGLGPGDILLDGDPLPPQKGHSPPLLRRHCVRWGPTSPLPKKGAEPPILGPCLLWPNGWMDQDGTWHGGGPRSRPHCARWGPISPSPKGAEASQFSAHFCCGQTAGCIMMPVGMEVRLGPGHIVLDGDQPPPKKRGKQPPI